MPRPCAARPDYGMHHAGDNRDLALLDFCFIGRSVPRAAVKVQLSASRLHIQCPQCFHKTTDHLLDKDSILGEARATDYRHPCTSSKRQSSSMPYGGRAFRSALYELSREFCQRLSGCTPYGIEQPQQ